MSRRPLIAGNWKMHLTCGQAVQLAQEIAASCGSCLDRDIMIAPAFTALAAVADALSDSTVKIGAQNVAWAMEGAFTGEISPLMLHDLKVEFVILGHSERRHIFHEDDSMINRRLHAAFQGGLTPILCIGETLEEREGEATFSVLDTQVAKGLEGVTAVQSQKLVLAYEPVWAIGTGKTATKEQAQEVHHFLRERLASRYEKKIADEIRILYGGSVKPDNIDSLMAQKDIDGALVGGAALKAESFVRIARFQ